MKDKIIYVTNSKRNIINLLEFVFLSKGGYEIKSFSTSKELLSHLSIKPDVLVVDDQSVTSKKTVQKFELKDIPIIILSENSNISEKSSDNGKLNYIQQKDYFIDDLVETVEKLTK